jgi:hypothetical protein
MLLRIDFRRPHADGRRGQRRQNGDEQVCTDPSDDQVQRKNLQAWPDGRAAGNPSVARTWCHLSKTCGRRVQYMANRSMHQEEKIENSRLESIWLIRKEHLRSDMR